MACNTADMEDESSHPSSAGRMMGTSAPHSLATSAILSLSIVQTINGLPASIFIFSFGIDLEPPLAVINPTVSLMPFLNSHAAGDIDQPVFKPLRGFEGCALTMAIHGKVRHKFPNGPRLNAFS